MCTAVAAQCILDALNARIKNGSVFTAFDVTKDARDASPTERISHRDVRRIVHNEFSGGQFPDDYRQDTIELDAPNNPVAIVYYPDGKLPTDHPKAMQTPNQPAPVQNAPVQNAAPNSNKSSKDGDDYICKVTSEGRVNIPKELCQQVANVGGTIDVSFNGSVLYKKMTADGRVRINNSDLGGADEYRVALDKQANTIVISAK